VRSVLRVFGSGPVAQNDFKARHDFAIVGDFFVANFLTEFPKRIEVLRSAKCVAPGIRAAGERLSGYAVFCSMLHFNATLWRAPEAVNRNRQQNGNWSRSK
jgi:hypothetical protein